MIVNSAALGLATIGDKDSIPLIVQACQRAPVEQASVIASSLVYFDGPQAQNAVDKYLSKEMAKASREKRANGGTPFR